MGEPIVIDDNGSIGKTGEGEEAVSALEIVDAKSPAIGRLFGLSRGKATLRVPTSRGTR